MDLLPWLPTGNMTIERTRSNLDIGSRIAPAPNSALSHGGAHEGG